MRRPAKYAKKVDANQAEIVSALRNAGVWVWPVGNPVDLLCRVNSDPPGVLRAIEVKVPKRTGNPKLDRRQLKQMEFIQLTGTSYATTPREALAAVGVTREATNG